jgi:putative ABC transport system permease protein
MLGYELFLAWRSLRSQRLTSLVLLVIIALAVALPIGVLVLGDAARQSIIRASDPFGMLVIGAKGSAQQLVLNTLLLQGLPVGNINARIYDTLLADARVSMIVPLAMGDSISGARLVGTSDALLEIRPDMASPASFRVIEGRFFAADFEAVLGSRAARGLGLRPGTQFLAQHGVERGLAGDMHEQPYTVVGIFDESGTPYDSAVFVSINSIWRAHQRDEDDPLTAFALGGAALDNQLTALLVRPVGFVEGNLLWQEFATGEVAQAAFPGQEIGGLFDLFRIGESVLTAVGYLVLVMSALVVFLSMFNAIRAREQSIAMLRTIGGGRMSIFRMVLIETLLLSLAGAILGRFLGYGIAWAIAFILSWQTSIPFTIRFLPALEPILWLATGILAIVAGILPAVHAYRIQAADKLLPT